MNAIQRPILRGAWIPPARPKKEQLVKKVALACLAELAVSIALGALVCCFVATPAGVSLILTTLAIQFAANAVLRSLSAAAYYKARHSKDPLLFGTAAGLRALPSLGFAALTGYNAQSLIHETGHALAAKAVYSPANPRIEIFPYQGAVTHFTAKKLTPLGKFLGVSKSALFVSAFGPGLSLLVSSICMGLGMAWRKKYPGLAMHLTAYGVFDFVSHGAYAASTYWSNPKDLSHDFVHLAHLGVHPMRAIAGMAAVPLLIALNGAILTPNRSEKDLRITPGRL